MKKIIKFIFVALLSLAIIFGIMIFAFPEKLMSFFIPTIDQVSDIRAEVEKDTAYIKTKLVAKNNTFFSLNMDTLKYKISFANKIYFNDKKILGIMLKSYDKDTFEFAFKVPYNYILKDMKKARKKGDSTNFETNLYLNYTTFFGKAELPITKSGKIKIPEPPEVEIVDLRYKKELPNENVLAEVKMKVINNSKFNLTVNKIDYTINILHFANVRGAHTKSLTIKGNSVSYIYLPIEVELKNMGKSLMSILNSDEPHHYIVVVDATIFSPDFKQEKDTHIKMIKEDDVILMQ